MKPRTFLLVAAAWILIPTAYVLAFQGYPDYEMPPVPTEREDLPPCRPGGDLIGDGYKCDPDTTRDQTGQLVTKAKARAYCEAADMVAVFYEDGSSTCKPVGEGDDIGQGA